MNEEHAKVVRQGTKSIRVWREENPDVEFDLVGADLSNADLSGADLSDLNLSNVALYDSDLTGANLSCTILNLADLSEAELTGANLNNAVMSRTNLHCANLEDAILTGVDLVQADLSRADLSRADLSRSELFMTNLNGVTLREAKLTDTVLYSTIFSEIDLSETPSLGSAEHDGPSAVSTSTLRLSKGKIPDVFLRGCGLQPWEVLHAKLYDPLLTREQKAEIHNEVFQKMVGPPIGGVFISYSHTDMGIADKLHAQLDEKEYSVWRDVHDMVAGPMERQVFDAIRAHDVVLLVLSEASVNSDWVELELEKAVAKEKEQGRPVLCPIAIDDSWKAKLKQSGSQVLWRKVKEKNVLDFSGDFDEPFRKLVEGMSRYYGSEAQGS